MPKSSRGGKIGTTSITKVTSEEHQEAPKQFERTDVLGEYERKATPGKGSLVIDNDCEKRQEHYKDELQFADWLYRKLGGDVHVLEEKKIKNRPDPDFLWNGKLWDLKTIKSVKAANTAIERGHKQIKSNPGGVMLNFNNIIFNMDSLIRTIDKRMNWYRGITDIMIVSNGEIIKILRYKK